MPALPALQRKDRRNRRGRPNMRLKLRFSLYLSAESDCNDGTEDRGQKQNHLR